MSSDEEYKYRADGEPSEGHVELRPSKKRAYVDRTYSMSSEERDNIIRGEEILIKQSKANETDSAESVISICAENHPTSPLSASPMDCVASGHGHTEHTESEVIQSPEVNIVALPCKSFFQLKFRLIPIYLI